MGLESGMIFKEHHFEETMHLSLSWVKVSLGLSLLMKKKATVLWSHPDPRRSPSSCSRLGCGGTWLWISDACAPRFLFWLPEVQVLCIAKHFTCLHNHKDDQEFKASLCYIISLRQPGLHKTGLTTKQNSPSVCLSPQINMMSKSHIPFWF